MRGGAVVAAVAALAFCAPALAQVPLPPLPPIGGQPLPPGGQPPPNNPPAPPAGAPSVAGTVAYGANPARTGQVADYTVPPPYQRRWGARTEAFQLLAAEGRMFEIGGTVRARALRSGRQLWRAGPFNEIQGAAYDHGILFVQLFDDLVALDARTGRTLWRHHLLDVAFAQRPVAAGGVVYTYFGQGGGTLVALRGSDGTVLWSKGTVDGSGGPALDGGRVFMAGACANAAAHSASSGATIWTHQTGCSGGGDVLARLYGGRVWVPDQEYTGSGSLDPPVLDANDGSVVRRTTITPLVIVDGLEIGNDDEALVARDAASGKLAWRFRKSALPSALAVGHQLLGTYDRLEVSDAYSGEFMWSGGPRTRNALATDSDTAPSFASAGHMVFVAAAGRLTAYRSRLRPRARGIALRATPSDVFAGGYPVIVGVLGSALRGGDPSVRITAADWRHGRFGRFDTVRSTGGGFQSYAQIWRNSRFRASAAGHRSRTFTAYAYPYFKIARPTQSHGRVHVRTSVESPHTKLAGRRLFVYLGHGRTVRRLAGSRLHGRRGKAHTVVKFRPLRHVSRRDRIYVCVRGALRIGLGRPTDMARRCGAHRVRRPR